MGPQTQAVQNIRDDSDFPTILLPLPGISVSRKAGMVPLQMELGGKDVCIVCEDANLDLAAQHIVKGGFSYSGQRCTAVKLVLVLNKV